MNELQKILKINFKENIKVSGITNSSQKVKQDSIFLGLKGTKTHGSNYALEAIKKGASIAIHDNPNYNKKNEKIIYVKNLEKKIIPLLNAFYKFDINKNKFYTFTGTNGKTSSAYFCHQILQDFGYNSLYVGTLGVQHKKNKFNTSFSSKTTPDLFELFEIIHEYNSKKDHINICIEISSHALDQKRLYGIDSFKSSSILNISNDHMDYHRDFLSYRNAKFKIFKTKSSIKLADGNLAKYSSNHYFKDNNIYFVSDKNNSADIIYNIEKISPKGAEFSVKVNNLNQGDNLIIDDLYKFNCMLFPDFNISNLVFAICSVGIDKFKKNHSNNLSFIKLPKGRAEFIRGISKNIIIDYAHNQHAFDSLLTSLKKNFENLVVVFGCGGDRDKNKRPKMLATAIKNSMKVIFTSDNSRSENFSKIFSDAKVGNKLDNVIEIEDRKEAIIYGNKILGKNDCMVILGKGHEQFQIIGSDKLNYSDHEVVNEIYR